MGIILAAQFAVASVVAGVTYPLAMLKKIEPPKYFSLEMSINLDGKPTSLNYVWHCENKRVFTGNNKWSVTWEESASTMVSKLSDNSYIVIPLPHSCDLKDGQEYVPNIARVKNQSDLDEIELYPGKGSGQDFGVSAVLKSGTIHVLERIVPDTTLSQEGELILKSLSDDQKHYSAIIVNKYPKSEWSKYWNLDQPERFERLEKFTMSTDITTPAERLGINRFVWKKGGGSNNLRMAYVRSIPLRATNLREVDGVWHINSEQNLSQSFKLKKNDRLYKLQAGYRNEKPIDINYKSYRFIQKGMIEQLYDPETKEILEFRVIRYNVGDNGYF